MDKQSGLGQEEMVQINWKMLWVSSLETAIEVSKQEIY